MQKRRSLYLIENLKNSIDSYINKEDFDKLSEILIKNQAVKRTKVDNGECLSLSKESVQHDQEIYLPNIKTMKIV